MNSAQIPRWFTLYWKDLIHTHTYIYNFYRTESQQDPTLGDDITPTCWHDCYVSIMNDGELIAVISNWFKIYSLVGQIKSHTHGRDENLSLPFIFRWSYTINILYEFLISPTYVTCTSNLNLLHLIPLIMFIEEYKLRSSSLCYFLNPPAGFSLSLLAQFNFRSTLFWSNFKSIFFP
jgi:hypothetical protein